MNLSSDHFHTAGGVPPAVVSVLFSILKPPLHIKTPPMFAQFRAIGGVLIRAEGARKAHRAKARENEFNHLARRRRAKFFEGAWCGHINPPPTFGHFAVNRGGFNMLNRTDYNDLQALRS